MIEEQKPLSKREFILLLREIMLNWDGTENFILQSKATLVILTKRLPELEAAFNRFSNKEKSDISVVVNNAIKVMATDYSKLADDSKIVGLSAIIRDKIKEALAKIDGVSGAEMYNAYVALCELDAMYDLLSGQLQRFDPVIGDLGCQWRVPFILDVYQDMIAAALEFAKKENVDLNYALSEYHKLRSILPSCNDILLMCKKSPMVSLQKGKTPVYKSKKMRVLVDNIKYFCTNIPSTSPSFSQHKENIVNCMRTWRTDIIHDFNPYGYLICCKVLTTNRIRTLDGFGLSGVPTELDIPDAKRTLNECILTIARNSLKYMTYVAQQTCIRAGLIIGEDGNAKFEDGRPDIHIAASALQLMQEAQFWTMQKGAYFLTQVCYGPLRSIFAYQATQRQPIIIDIRRLICTRTGAGEDDYGYTYNGGAILYFEPDENGVFRYYANPSPEQRINVGMICEAYSMVLEGDQPQFDDPDRVFYSLKFNEYLDAVVNHCSIMDLILFGITSHSELTTNICGGVKGKAIPALELNSLVCEKYKEATGRDEMPPPPADPWVICGNPVPFPNALTPDWDLLIEKEYFWSALRKFNLDTVQYKKPTPGRRTEARRVIGTVPFGPIHIFGGTYEHKMNELTAFQENTKEEDKKGIRIVRDEDCKPRDGQ